MARKRKVLPLAYRAITDEIEAHLNRSDRGEQKRLAAAAGIDSAAFRHRMDEYRGERFSYEELEAIRREARKPPGWPYVRESEIVTGEEAETLQALRKLLQRDGR